MPVYADTQTISDNMTLLLMQVYSEIHKLYTSDGIIWLYINIYNLVHLWTARKVIYFVLIANRDLALPTPMADGPTSRSKFLLTCTTICHFRAIGKHAHNTRIFRWIHSTKKLPRCLWSFLMRIHKCFKHKITHFSLQRFVL